jgi:FtsP/CotA-like multicopper oxidase with cupredoxin domain
MSVMEELDTGTRAAGAAPAHPAARREMPWPIRSYAAAALTMGAAAIHFAVAPDHLAEYPLYGIFFILLAVAQVGLVVAVLAVPSRRLFAGAAAGTLAIVGLWLVSRTVGLPLAPVPWHPEAIGVPDVATTLMEGVSAVLFLLLLWRPRRARRRGRIRMGLMTAPALLIAIPATVLGVGSALAPMPMAFNSAPAVPGQASTSLVDLVAPPGNEPVKSFTLTAAVTQVGGREAWAYNGTLPGPELRVNQGDRLKVTLVNHLPAATSIHWHGIRLPNAVDGVAGITQDAVPPGRSYVYEFIANDAGTFWYHAHQDTNVQIPLGLLGALVVEPRAASVPQKRDYSLTMQTLPGDSIAINGRANLHLDALPGETVRLRLINGAVPDVNGPPVLPVLLGAQYTITALDGHDLNAPQTLGPERIPLGMGQRADLVFTMPASGAARLVAVSSPPPATPGDPAQTTATATIGAGPLPTALDLASLPRFDLTGYGLPAPDPVADAPAYDHTQQLVIGGGPGFRNGGIDFVDQFNGKASPYVPPIVVREGELVRLHIVNPSSEAFHPIHIHGHVFSILAKNGHRLTGSPVHVDAVLVGPHETWDVAFKADNPGIWMLHCHVLAHAASGMSMTINYAGISTPFTMGTRSGNQPE